MARVAFAASCFVVSGAMGLVYEIVWVRQLTIVFGSTSLATSTVLAAFMAGLALGASVAGARVRPEQRLLLAYGLLEVGLGLFALATPWLFTGVDALVDAVYDAMAPGRYGAVLLRVAVSTAVLVVPTTCMGATLPVLSVYVTAREEHVGRSVGLLYALNTAGAVAGTLAAGFVLLPAHGARATLAGTAALNVVVGAAAVAVGRRAPTGAPARARATSVPAEHTPLAVLALVAVSGATALTYEIGWMRLLGMALTTSVYAFTTVLATFLLGLALGGAAFGTLADRLDRRLRPVLVAALAVAAGLSALVTLRWLQELPILYAAWFRHIVPVTASATAERQYHVLALLRFGLAAVVMLPSTVFLGGVLPVAVRVATDTVARVGGSVGRIYALNTAGAIAGSLAASLFLIPAVGIRAMLVGAAGANLVAACVVLGSLRAAALPARALGVVAVLGLGTVAAWTLPLLDARVLSAAVHWNVRRLRTGDRADFEALIRPYALRFHRDGITETVTVAASVDDERNRWMALDGQVDASTRDDLPTQVLLGEIPMAFAPRTSDVLVIGLASGMTLGSVLRHAVERVTMVEIEPAVYDACRRFFASANHHALDDPRVTVAFDDARTFLRHARDRWDVIVSEPSHPWRSGSARLFTREFWEQSRRALRDGGVFGQWMHLYALQMREAQSLVRTFHDVFPETYVFELMPGEDVLLLGSARPLGADLERLRARLAVPAVAADLRRIGGVAPDFPDMSRPASLLATLRLGRDDVPEFVGDAPTNTDDNGWVEFSAARSVFVSRGAEIADALARRTDALRWVDGADGDAAFLAELARAYLAFRQPAAARRIATRARALDPSFGR